MNAGASSRRVCVSIWRRAEEEPASPEEVKRKERSRFAVFAGWPAAALPSARVFDCLNRSLRPITSSRDL